MTRFVASNEEERLPASTEFRVLRMEQKRSMPEVSSPFQPLITESRFDSLNR
jgi:hypothetical protein